MIVIVVTVITQGFRVPSESRGDIKSHLVFNTGFFQAVGVISFGELQLFRSMIEKPTNDYKRLSAVCFPSSCLYDNHSFLQTTTAF